MRKYTDRHELIGRNGFEMTPRFLETAGASFDAAYAEVKNGDLTVSGIFDGKIENICVNGDLVVKDSRGVIFENISVKGALRILSPEISLQNCRFGQVEISADGVTLRNCTVQGDINATGENLLVALSVAESILFENCKNSVCLLDIAKNIRAVGSKNIYICENRAREVAVEDCDYLIVNGNDATGEVICKDSMHFVGNDVTDINARMEIGVNEALLPAVDKYCHLFMERRSAVLEDKHRRADIYVSEEAAENELVIVPPGAYRTSDSLKFDGNTGCVLYAYGVLFERNNYSPTVISLNEASGVVIKGLRTGYDFNPSRQGIVVAKESGETLRIMSCPGMRPDWADTRYYRVSGDSMHHYKFGHREFSCDAIPLSEGGYVYHPETNTMTCRFPKSVYESICVGDTVGGRGMGSLVVGISRSRDIFFEDFTMYGAPAFAINESYAHTPTVLHRVLDTTAPRPRLSREEYDAYKRQEERWGVDFDLCTVASDKGETAYLGSDPICSSVDATHTRSSRQGTVAISCVFESMCDDGTNQSSFHSRLGGVRDNGDGTVTVKYKSSISPLALSWNSLNGYLCAHFDKGDRVYIYTSSGKLVCDTAALCDYREAGTYTNTYGAVTRTFEVEVKAEDIDLSTCAEYDLESDVPTVPKILVDNMSQASNGFIFDNMLIRNVRSRGLLIKASDGLIRNCSFYKIGGGAIALRYEIQWGESGVSENVKIERNYCEETGYFDLGSRSSPLTVLGLGSEPKDEYLLYRNIEFSSNKIVGRGSDHAMYLNSAKGVRVIGNDFGMKKDETEESATHPVLIKCVKDVEFSGNIYSSLTADNESRFKHTLHLNVYGSDFGGVLEEEEELFATLERSVPTVNSPKQRADNTADYSNTPWSAGYLSKDAFQYTEYKYINGAMWFAADPLKGGTNSTGGIALTSALQSAEPEYNVGYRYTAPKDMTARIGYLEVIPPKNSDAYIAIFKNGEMIWPEKGGSYTDSDSWMPLVTSFGMRAKSILEPLHSASFELKKGDEIFFVSRARDGESMLTALPIVAIEA